jgi:hypothetical protein
MPLPANARAFCGAGLDECGGGGTVSSSSLQVDRCGGRGPPGVAGVALGRATAFSRPRGGRCLRYRAKIGKPLPFPPSSVDESRSRRSRFARRSSAPPPAGPDHLPGFPRCCTGHAYRARAVHLRAVEGRDGTGRDRGDLCKVASSSTRPATRRCWPLSGVACGYCMLRQLVRKEGEGEAVVVQAD